MFTLDVIEHCNFACYCLPHKMEGYCIFFHFRSTSGYCGCPLISKLVLSVNKNNHYIYDQGYRMLSGTGILHIYDSFLIKNMINVSFKYDHAVNLYWAWSMMDLSYSLLLSHMVYHCAVLSLQLFASCVAWDPSFQKVDATHHQLIPPFSSKPQVSLCCIITFVFRVIMCDDPSFQEQSVCMTRNMKTWFQMFQPWIQRFVSLNVYIVEHLHSFKHAHYMVKAHPVYTNINFDYT